MRRANAELDDDDPTAEEPALETDGTATDQLDGTYRARVAAAAELRDGDPSATADARYPTTAAEVLELEGQWQDARSALDAALMHHSLAAAAAIGRIRTGESVPKVELDAEWQARLRLREARRLFDRLDRLRNLAAVEKY